MSDRVVWHQYRTVKYGDTGIEQMYCCGHWYELGLAPCTIEDEKTAQGLASLPACEVDDEDIAAMRELLQVPDRASVCRQKGRASWFAEVKSDKPLSPDQVQAYTQIGMMNQVLVVGKHGVKWIDPAPLGNCVCGEHHE